MGARQRHWQESRGRSCQAQDGAHRAGTARGAQQHPTALRRRGRGSVAQLEVQELGCVPSSSQGGRKKLLPQFLRRKFLSQKRGAARSHALVQLTLSIHTRGDLTWLETANKLVLHPEQGLGVPDRQKPAVSAVAPQNFNSRIAWIDPLWQGKAPP